MTEQEWLECTDPREMLLSLRGKVSDRKLRLIAAGCCRRVWHLLVHLYSREAVMVAERFAEGGASARELESACLHASHVTPDPAYEAAPPYSIVPAIDHARRAAIFASASPINDNFLMTANAARFAASAAASPGWEAHRADWREVMSARQAAEHRTQADLLREVFGVLPFHPVTITPTVLAWNDDMVPRVAQAIFERRAFDRMPILGDALEEAGCANTDIRAHCREQGAHAPGCWVLDLTLCKE